MKKKHFNILAGLGFEIAFGKVEKCSIEISAKFFSCKGILTMYSSVSNISTVCTLEDRTV